MTELTNQANGELETSTDSTEGVPADASTTDNGEENKTNTAEQQRQKQVASWQAKLDSGVATMADVPHDWLKKELKPIGQDLDALVEKKLEERFKAKEVEASLNSLKLSPEAKQALLDKADKLALDGLPRDKALEILIESEARVIEGKRLSDRRQAMAMSPRGGTPANKPKDWSTMSQEELAEHVLKSTYK